MPSSSPSTKNPTTEDPAYIIGFLQFRVKRNGDQQKSGGKKAKWHLPIITLQQSLILLLFFLPLIRGQGCSRQGRPLCCQGRDFNCKSREATALRPIYRFSLLPGQTPSEVRCRDKRIGFTDLLPGFVALEETEAAASALQHIPSEHFRLYAAKKRERRKVAAGKDETDEEEEEESEEAEELAFHLGWPWEEWTDWERLVTDQQSWPLIRYSLLRKNLPLRVLRGRPGKEEPLTPQQPPLFGSPSSTLEAQQWQRTFFVAQAGAECFCDQLCAKYGDCCSDYMAHCPPVDCQLSAWSHWSECVPDGNASCGVGVRERHRHMLVHRQNAGAECPADGLAQQMGCFRPCISTADARQGLWMEGGQHAIPDVTTVALLLDYRFNKSRQLLPRFIHRMQNQKSKKSRRAAEEEKLYSRYCVHYRIEWLNRNCLESEWRSKLAGGQRICAECQPEAQFHRPRPRCASDLEDGQSGFWKLIGPKSCYGIWRRLRASNSDCDCAHQFPQLSPFLLV